MITKRRFLSIACAGGLASVAPASWRPAHAQTVRGTARMLVGSPPGGSTDTVARLLASEMKGYASTIIVENRPGAGNRIALDVLKMSPADGSALTLTPASMLVIYPHIYKSLNYDPVTDFIPVSTVCSFPFLVTIGPRVPARVKSLGEFIAWCKANPSEASYGSPGAGTMLHFTGVMLARAAGFEFVHVPYQGARSIQDVIGGQLAASINPISTALPHVQSGKLRALMVTGQQRSALVPDVPTAREVGFPDLEGSEWFGIVVPARAPSDIVDKLNAAIRDALNSSTVRSGLAKLALDAGGSSRDEFARLIKSDTARWGAIVRASGFKPED